MYVFEEDRIFFKLFGISYKTKIKNSGYFYQSRENVLLRKISQAQLKGYGTWLSIRIDRVSWAWS